MTTSSFNLNLPGYSSLEELYRDPKTVVYRGIQIDADLAENSRPVVIKLLSSEYPTYQELLKFRHQYTITQDLDLPGVVRTYSLEEYGRGYGLVMEDGGISLAQYRQLSNLTFPDVLKIAIQISDTLHALARQRIVHKDLKPANILIDPISKQVKLIDFSIASRLPRETQEILNPNLLEGTLAYLSPEQTGRMNRGIDYRSDFYAFGITLYELLTGKLPFEVEFTQEQSGFLNQDESSYANELVHCHLAKIAVPVNIINPDVPVVIAQIVAKLMAKNAEDRYQSAVGLKYDLEQCLTQWQTTGGIKLFDLAQRDLSNRFMIPEKLYGRELAVQTLLDAFARIASPHEHRVVAGNSELMLVAGGSGIGKTAIVKEIHKPIVRQNGYFIKGKFDQFNRNIPLSGFVQAFRDLIGQLLSESDARLAVWNSKILAAVGENGQVLIEVIPELERIIGKQSPVPELIGTAAQHRFNLLFQKLIEVFTTAEHPLVLFLDDLQWADSASIQSIELLMEGKGYLLLLGAYRDNEVSPIHPLMLMVEKLKQADKVVQTITIEPLKFSDVNQLVADTLHCGVDRAKPLAALINNTTKGNPFFTTQLLKSLHTSGKIQFNPPDYLEPNGSKGGWECDIAQVKAAFFNDDVVEFMAEQLQQLPQGTQRVLKLAACIGNQFDLETVAIVSEQSQQLTATALWQGLEAGLIIPTSQIYKFWSTPQPIQSPQTSPSPPSSHTPQTPHTPHTPPSPHAPALYRFLHDRVQQAAYSLIPDSDRAVAHDRIGKLLLAKISDAALEEQIFVVVSQLNHGIPLIVDLAEIDRLAQLNLVAARKAKLANAYQSAIIYAQIAIDLLGSDGWDRQYDLSLTLHELATEVAFLCGDSARMNRFFEMTIDRAQTRLDRVGVYLVRIQANTFQSQYLDAIWIGQSILQEFDI